jgi:hypothetical protein
MYEYYLIQMLIYYVLLHLLFNILIQINVFLWNLLIMGSK